MNLVDVHAHVVPDAAAAGGGHLVLTHLIPPPPTPEVEAAFAADVRSGGFEGRLTVGRDLVTVALPADADRSAGWERPRGRR